MHDFSNKFCIMITVLLCLPLLLILPFHELWRISHIPFCTSKRWAAPRGMVDAARRLSWDTKKGEKRWQGRRLAALPSLLLGASIYDVRIFFGIFYRPLLLVRNWDLCKFMQPPYHVILV